MKLFLLGIFVFASILSSAQTGSKLSEKDAKAALDFHNKVRKEVGVAPLQWSVELAAYAQQWAEHLASKGCVMEHRPRTGVSAERFGENIFWGSSNFYNVEDACASWYAEKKDFTGPVFTGRETKVVGHYTQMVWGTTTKVGIGIARCKSGAIIIVANYDPPGNFLGRNPY